MPTVLRPRTATELVDAAFQLLRRRYIQFVSIAAVFLIPVIVLEVTAMAPQRATMPSPSYFAAFFVVAILALLSTAAVTVGVSDSYVHDRVDVLYAIRRVLSRLLPILGGTFATIITVFAVMLVLVTVFAFLATGVTATMGGRVGGVAAIAGGALGVAGVVLGFLSTYARIFAVPMVIVLEGTTVGNAFTRSMALTEGAVWRIMGVFVLVFFIFGALFALLVGLGTVLTVQYPGLVTAYTVLTGTINVFVYPIYTVFVTLLYYDLRIRRDGYDLEVMTRELTGTSAPAQA
jgi:hypothetical protein